MASEGHQLLAWLGRRDQEGVAELGSLLGDHPLVALPLLPEEPTDIAALGALGCELASRLDAAEAKG